MELVISGELVLIDDCDYDRIKNYKWYAIDGSGYSKRICTMKPCRYMHRIIMDAPIGYDVDHVNGNALDNRRSNLRICSHAENTRNAPRRKTNASGYKGVYWASWASKYRAEIQHSGSRIKIGYFDTADQAYKAYCDAARELHGDFARY